MKSASPSSQRGLTLLEVIIAMAIIATAIGLVGMTLKFIQNQFRSMQRLDIQRQGESMLFELVRDIRNARAVLSVSTSPVQEIVLSSYNLDFPADIKVEPNFPDNNIFSQGNMKTITYRYVEAGAEAYLLRKIELGGTVQEERKLLVNLIKPEDLSTPHARPIFSSEAPYRQVEIVLPLGGGWYRNDPKVFRTSVMPRSKPVQ